MAAFLLMLKIGNETSHCCRNRRTEINIKLDLKKILQPYLHAFIGTLSSFKFNFRLARNSHKFQDDL